MISKPTPLTLVAILAMLGACAGPSAPSSPGDSDGGCILALRPHPSGIPPVGHAVRMAPADPKYMDFLYGLEKEFLSFDFMVGDQPLYIRPRGDLPKENDSDHFELKTGNYTLQVHFVLGDVKAAQRIDSIVLRVYRPPDLETPVQTVCGKDYLLNHHCFGPAVLGLPITKPRVAVLPYKNGKVTAIGVYFDAFGIETGLTLVGQWLLRQPEWVAEVLPREYPVESHIARDSLSDAGCIVDPRPRPAPGPIFGEEAGTAASYHHDWIQYYTTGPEGTAKEESYEIDFYVYVDPSHWKTNRVYLAPYRDPEDGDDLELASGWNKISLSYRARFVLRDQIELTLGEGKKAKTLRVSFPDLRTSGQFRAPELVPLGIQETDHGTMVAVGVELEAFGVRSGFVLLGRELELRN